MGHELVMSVPKVVIVGRPNVGKSSLLNWLAGRRLAIVDDVAGITRDRMIYQIEHEPPRFRQQGQTIWQHHGWTLAQSQGRVQDLGELEPRLLKIVLAELERSLRAQSNTYGQMYSKPNHFWAEHEPSFRRVAEKVGMRYEKNVMLAGYTHPDRLYALAQPGEIPAADA